METKQNMRPRRRLFPERTSVLFAGTIIPIIRTLLYGPSKNNRFLPQLHSVRFGVPNPPVLLVFECFSYHMRFLVYILRIYVYEKKLKKTTVRSRIWSKLILASYVLCCLLYTSPSPRDLSTSRMPSSA